jgi:hypothetical protein
MKQEEIIDKDEVLKMARQAGYKDLPTVRLAFQGFDKIAFAKLVASAATAKEREACAKVCAQVKGEMYSVNGCIAAIRARGTHE